ncbi:hypothetical protein FB645_004418 [Coemansia sp. IMI 203386]|nr:hypothetical protein FB645_004418 [Coemansia sp. IMI 203386]
MVSPLTLQSDDIVELVVSHAQTPVGLGTPTATSSSVQPTLESSASVSQTTTVESSWVTTPAAHELFELAEPTDPTNTVDDYSEEILPKRLFRMLRKRGPFAYKSQEDESEDAARSARSLLSVMREIASRSENSSPKRQSQISAIRSVLDKQVICPDDVVLDDDEYRDQFQPPILYQTTIRQIYAGASSPDLCLTTITASPTTPSSTTTSSSTSSNPPFVVAIATTTTTTSTATMVSTTTATATSISMSTILATTTVPGMLTTTDAITTTTTTTTTATSTTAASPNTATVTVTTTSFTPTVSTILSVTFLYSGVPTTTTVTSTI